MLNRQMHPRVRDVEGNMCCRGGLEGHLLGLALQAEQPQLEAQRTALLQQEEEQRLQLAALDTHLLQSLATSKVLPWLCPLIALAYTCLFWRQQSGWNCMLGCQPCASALIRQEV